MQCALLCVACLLFLGLLGCSKCLKQFPGHLGQRDYSGFDRTLWQLRTEKVHRQNVESIRKCTTVQSQSELESKFGCRYSILLDLPYFDPVRMTVIDPIIMLKNVWIKNGVMRISLLFKVV